MVDGRRLQREDIGKCLGTKVRFWVPIKFHYCVAVLQANLGNLPVTGKFDQATRVSFYPSQGSK